MNFVERYLRDNPSARRHYCKVCKTIEGKTLKKLNEGLTSFTRARIAGQTTMSWDAFTTKVVKPEFDGAVPSYKSLRNHTEHCLGEEVN